MNRIANVKDLEKLHEKYPSEFVLAIYDNKNNFRVAKSTTGALKKFGFDYYGEFVGKKLLYVHKNDLADNIVKVNIPKSKPVVNTIELEPVNDEIEIELKPINDEIELESNTDEVELESNTDEIETMKPKRKRKSKE